MMSFLLTWGWPFILYFSFIAIGILFFFVITRWFMRRLNGRILRRSILLLFLLLIPIIINLVGFRVSHPKIRLEYQQAIDCVNYSTDRWEDLDQQDMEDVVELFHTLRISLVMNPRPQIMGGSRTLVFLIHSGNWGHMRIMLYLDRDNDLFVSFMDRRYYKIKNQDEIIEWGERWLADR
ncbi:hypothetical protein [Anaerolentibacter hominis]|uniref:hypothetical protein n=1 Tax=Anaerolentibacter hominis TaxID=3079009 RepID=UPI0031B7FD7B